jgi:integrase
MADQSGLQPKPEATACYAVENSRGAVSSMDALKNRIATFIMESGERYCLLCDRATGMPLFYPNLYVTTQIRNNSLSVSAMKTALTSINVFLSYCDDEELDLEKRFIRRQFFTLSEIDGIRDCCQKRFKKEHAVTSTDPVLVSPKRKQKPSKPAKSTTEYVRLTYIGKYSKWLAEILHSGPIDRNTSQAISAMQKRMNSRRPKRKGRNQLKNEKGLDENQVDLLTELTRPGSEHNPFPKHAIQVRNRLIIFVLLHLGKRGGELLNIRGRDIDWDNNQIVIARRPDEKDDPRSDQPLTKTLDHRMPVEASLMDAIHKYINRYRKKVPNARTHDYLFVTHKAGPTQGQPLSISSYHKILKTIAQTAPELENLHGHALRHTWNHRFSVYMDTMDNPLTPEAQEQLRSYLQGWKHGSGTAKWYTQRFVREKAMEIGLELQKRGKTRIPENLAYEF